MSTFVTPQAASQSCKSSARAEEGTYVAPKSIPTKNLPMLAASAVMAGAWVLVWREKDGLGDVEEE